MLIGAGADKTTVKGVSGSGENGIGPGAALYILNAMRLSKALPLPMAAPKAQEVGRKTAELALTAT
jgi:hypothetical protein